MRGVVFLAELFHRHITCHQRFRAPEFTWLPGTTSRQSRAGALEASIDSSRAIVVRYRK
jgi:hypothetical protein